MWTGVPIERPVPELDRGLDSGERRRPIAVSSLTMPHKNRKHPALIFFNGLLISARSFADRG